MRDVSAARAILAALPRGQRTPLITDGVFSMDGDLGALPGLCDIADEFGCIMMVDDAHASGVFGSQGRGTVDHFGLHGRVDVQVGTLSIGFDEAHTITVFWRLMDSLRAIWKDRSRSFAAPVSRLF